MKNVIALIAAIFLCMPSLGLTQTPTKLRPKQQKALLLQLKQLEDSADGIRSAGDRAYALMEIAPAYAAVDRPHSVTLLDDALSLMVGVPPSSSKSFLQETIAIQAVLAEPEKLDDIASSLPGTVRHQVLQAVLSKYLVDKKFDQAVGLVYAIANDSEFPYSSADLLLRQVTTLSRAEKQALFSFALSSYKKHQHNSYNYKDDFGLLLVHCWREMAPASVEDAILYILHEAQGESGLNGPSSRISVVGSAGSASFDTLYDFRLFQLLPVLRQIDSAKADELLRGYSGPQEAFRRYPEGLSSMAPQERRGDPHLLVGVSRGRATLQLESPSYENEAEKARQLVDLSMKDASQSLSTAETLTYPSLEAMALESIAQAVKHSDSMIAREALRHLLEIAPKLPPQLRAKYLISATEIYLSMRQPDDAQSSLSQAAETVEELYRQDSDKDDPNMSLKVFWPSTAMWQRLMGVAIKISSQSALSILKTVPDKDIALLMRISLERSELGVPPLPLMTITMHKDGEVRYKPDEESQ